MRNIRFSKLNGAGNDFLIIDNRKNFIKNKSIFAKEVCDRKRSVGADGVLLLENSKVANFKMLIFNSDGSSAEMCGNGIRCIGLYAYSKNICGKKMTIETPAGLKHVTINNRRTGDVSVNMGKPSSLKLNIRIKVDNKLFTGYFVNTGVPHTVIFNSNVNVKDVGRKIRFYKIFKPAGTNVNFVKVLGKNKMEVRTYERGVEDETYACGTGATASTYIASLIKRIRFPVVVSTLRGDTLTIDTDKHGNLYMSGKVKYVCEGILI